MFHWIIRHELDARNWMNLCSLSSREGHPARAMGVQLAAGTLRAAWLGVGRCTSRAPPRPHLVGCAGRGLHQCAPHRPLSSLSRFTLNLLHSVLCMYMCKHCISLLCMNAFAGVDEDSKRPRPSWNDGPFQCAFGLYSGSWTRHLYPFYSNISIPWTLNSFSLNTWSVIIEIRKNILLMLTAQCHMFSYSRIRVPN